VKICFSVLKNVHLPRVLTLRVPRHSTRRAARNTHAVLTKELRCDERSTTATATAFYPVTLEYDIRAVFAGRQKGKKLFNVPSEHFDASFMERLRREKLIDQGVFKIKHLGVENVKTIFNENYPACDKVLVYDFKWEKVPKFAELIHEMFEAVVEEQPGIHPMESSAKNVKLVLYIYKQGQELPVLGAVKVDLSGRVRGMDIQAGFDYLPDSVPDPDARRIEK
jgi:hypothetical protein